jgi:hypothetical protein
MLNHKVGDLVYGSMTGLGMIIRIDSGNNGGYPYVVEWYDLVKSDITIPSYHDNKEIEYFKKYLELQQ